MNKAVLCFISLFFDVVSYRIILGVVALRLVSPLNPPISWNCLLVPLLCVMVLGSCPE